MIDLWELLALGVHFCNVDTCDANVLCTVSVCEHMLGEAGMLVDCY